MQGGGNGAEQVGAGGFLDQCGRGAEKEAALLDAQQAVVVIEAGLPVGQRGSG